ncbi:hypothetical protein NLX83_15730 [Allokutzneria sp. A3M-2-11 16]|uniref:hypothetical protein n=1 Tax=Allokutzneria sp. A3M-2-11 16 TaxID=2962043 RepID=UPI0020B7F330|nr:hypothetical protein [Allokutzneria sp. A3M-2-11 16]MCP3800718.1 hypothetical protein [Allokutzneria sp. A3M-2-11 16]
MDFSTLPRGQIAWSSLINEISKTDDRVERHYLELKSDIDLDEAAGRAKVVKFILGAANRDPDIAARYLEGHALMILGVAPGAIHGIRAFEAKDLQRFVDRCTGTPGPGWDFERIPAANGRDVIIIVVMPPTGEVWTCRNDGADKLTDGAIFLRADGETRLAKGAEVRAMIDRVQRKPVAVELDVKFLGSAVRHPHESEEALNEYLEHVAGNLRRLPKRSELSLSPEVITAFSVISSMPPVDRRSRAAFLDEVERWKEKVREAWPELLDHLAGAAGHGSHLSVHNNSDAFLENAQLQVNIGPARTIDPVERDDFSLTSTLPNPPTPWGTDTLLQGAILDPLLFADISSRTPANVRGVSYRNYGSFTTLTVDLGALRPRSVHVTDIDEFVLTTRASDTTELHGTWSITARGHHRVFEGELIIPVRTLQDTNKVISSILIPNSGGHD